MIIYIERTKRVVRTNINLAETRDSIDIPKINCIFLCIHKETLEIVLK